MRFIQNWFSKRNTGNDKRSGQAEKTVEEINEEGELRIQFTLAGIDFIHSRLPKEILEHRTNPEQSCGDLELAAVALAQRLRNNPVTIHADIRAIDQKIYTLAELYKYAVERGYVNTAYAAKAGLARGIQDIRCRISAIQPELMEQFVDLNARYLDLWSTLVGYAQEADLREANLEEAETVYKNRQDEYKENTRQMYTSVKGNYEACEAFQYFQNASDLENRDKWTDTRKQWYETLLNQHYQCLKLQIDETFVNDNKLQYQNSRNRVDNLSAKLCALAIPENHEQMSEFNAAIDDVDDWVKAETREFQELREIPQSVDGLLKEMSAVMGQKEALEAVVAQAHRTPEDMRNLTEEMRLREEQTC